MTYLVERLVELQRYLEHLQTLKRRVFGRASLEQDLSLRNDVLFSLFTVCQLVHRYRRGTLPVEHILDESPVNRRWAPASG